MLLRISNSNVSVVASFHNLPMSVSVPQAIMDTAEKSDWVYFERDLEATPIDAVRPVSKRLASVLADTEMDLLTKLWSGPAVNRPTSELETFSAGDVADIVDRHVAAHRFQMYREHGVDCKVWKATPGSKRRYVQSEGELSRLVAYPEDEQFAELRYSIDIKRREEDLRSELDAWRRGDAPRLGELTDRIYERTPQRAEIFLRQRNSVMLAAIDTALDDTAGSSLFILGAAHVFGQNGILNTLKARGEVITLTT